MASTAASGTVASLVLLLISLIVLLGIRYYVPLRSAPAYLIFSIFLAVTLPSSAIVLLPIDLASSSRVEDEAAKGIWLPQRLVLVSWRLVYWIGFVLMWVVLPLLAEYMDSGYRDPHQKIMYSLRSNGRYQAITIGCGILGLLYISFSYGFDFTAIKGLVIALAYVWGLFLAIALMGHGLVAVPRSVLLNADTAGRLKRVQTRAAKVHEKLEDAIITLEDVEGQIEQLKKRKTSTARDFQDWIDELADMIGTTAPRLTLATPDLESGKIPAVITERYLADITRRFNRARHQRARYVEEWDLVVATAYKLQLILDSHASKKLTFNTTQSDTLTRYITLTPTLRYHLYVNILPYIRFIFGGILALASLSIIFSEIMRFPAPQYSAVSLTVIHHPNSKTYQIGIGGQITAAFWITYMCTTALTSITSVPVWNQRALVHRNTSFESACWYAGQIARLTVPLAYNFLTFLPVDVHENTTFYNFLGKLINLTPLGTWFENLFPMFVLIPACATLFNLYGRIKNICGFGFIDDDEEDGSAFSGGWREGRDLIARDLNGSRGNTLGLLSSSSHSSPRDSGDLNGSPRWASPARRTGAPRSIGVEGRSGGGRSIGVEGSSARSSSLLNPANERRRQTVIDPEPDEENFFTLFGRRVKNTFDTLETPGWMNNDNGEGQKVFSKPKWLSGDDGDDRNVFDRLFNSGRPQGEGGNSGRIVL